MSNMKPCERQGSPQLDDAEAAFLSGDIEGATQALDQLLRLGPKSARLFCLEGALAYHRGFNQEAMSAFYRARALAPTAGEPRDNLARLHLEAALLFLS